MVSALLSLLPWEVELGHTDVTFGEHLGCGQGRNMKAIKSAVLVALKFG